MGLPGFQICKFPGAAFRVSKFAVYGFWGFPVGFAGSRVRGFWIWIVFAGWVFGFADQVCGFLGFWVSELGLSSFQISKFPHWVCALVGLGLSLGSA